MDGWMNGWKMEVKMLRDDSEEEREREREGLRQRT